jgi:hypothetical protein
MLLNAGADVKAKSSVGSYTPLDFAKDRNEIKMVGLLEEFESGRE